MTLYVHWFTNPTEHKIHLNEFRGTQSLLKGESINMSDFGYVFRGQPGSLMYPALFWSSENKPEKPVIERLLAEYAKRYDFVKVKKS